MEHWQAFASDWYKCIIVINCYSMHPRQMQWPRPISILIWFSQTYFVMSFKQSDKLKHGAIWEKWDICTKFKSNVNEIERNLTLSEQTLREIVSFWIER
jgi:hypothetical protein